jgi:hypothetical protein
MRWCASSPWTRTGVPTLASTRDLGLISGDIAGIAVAGGKVILTGTSRDSGLSAGTTTNANSGGKDVFVASPVDRSDAVDRRPAELVRHGGRGHRRRRQGSRRQGLDHGHHRQERDRAAATDPTKGYLARLDPVTGAVEYEQSWTGVGDQAKPATLAIASNGASVLDRLGLPQGEIDQSDSKP